MTQLRAAMWVHGTIVQVEYPKRLVPADPDVDSTGFRRGGGTTFRGGSLDPVKAFNWFHFPITTPVILDDTRPSLVRVFVFYKTSGRARVTNLHLWDGGTARVWTQDDLVGYSGDHSTGIDALNTWTPPPLTIRFGLVISVGVNFGYDVDTPLSDILFTTAGADFAPGT